MQQPVKRQGSKFNRFFWYASSICLVLMLLFAFFVKHTSEEDILDYQALMKFSGEDKNVIPETSYTLNQSRQRVRKDIVFVEGGDRKKLRLTSAKADVIVDKVNRNTMVDEKLMDVCCWMQEEVYYKLQDGREAKRQPDGKLLLRKSKPEEAEEWIDETMVQAEPWQKLRFMQADVAYYSYSSEILDAEQVRILRYQLPGHELPDSIEGLIPMLDGVADAVSFSLGGKELNFKATKFKATVNSMDDQ